MTDQPKPSELAKQRRQAIRNVVTDGSLMVDEMCERLESISTVGLAELEADLASALENIHQSVEVEAELRLDLQGAATEVVNLEARLAWYVCQNCGKDEHGLMANEACTVLRWDGLAQALKSIEARLTTLNSAHRKANEQLVARLAAAERERDDIKRQLWNQEKRYPKVVRERDEARAFALSLAQELASMVGDKYGFDVVATEGEGDGTQK